MTDYWSHHYFDNPSVDEVEDEDFDLDTMLAEMEDDDWEDL